MDNASNNLAAFNNIILPEFEDYFNKITKDDESGSESNDEESDDCGSDGNKRLQANEVDDSAYQTSLNSPAEEEFMRLPCFSHSLQLVVNDGIKASGTALSCLKKLFNQATVLTQGESYATVTLVAPTVLGILYDLKRELSSSTLILTCLCEALI
ncbi:unnamed protein product [Rotaria magnacalcarata]|uniref:Uncharacterized protein n=1 Tax=Rotaria magnacalcarata TaxID=392030 RepID=A0A8S3HAM0_9BILA|nr:unnamed protein product [Rotaria magnacalcarata]CAF5179352.1 unnamed protein product [Rotaria magnacalcarata]